MGRAPHDDRLLSLVRTAQRHDEIPALVAGVGPDAGVGHGQVELPAALAPALGPWRPGPGPVCRRQEPGAPPGAAR